VAINQINQIYTNLGQLTRESVPPSNPRGEQTPQDPINDQSDVPTIPKRAHEQESGRSNLTAGQAQRLTLALSQQLQSFPLQTDAALALHDLADPRMIAPRYV